jgi:hypothetical protein
MYNDDTEILFPSRVIPTLKGFHGTQWDELVDTVINYGNKSIDHVAFVLMMIKLGGCVSCNADSFRAMKGCTQCAKQTIRRYRGDDRELLRIYAEAFTETQNYFNQNG